MKTLAVLFCAVCLFGCSSLQQLSTPEVVPPQLLVQHPLPSVPVSLSNNDLTLDMQIYVAEDGSVKSVHFNKGSGDTDWDLRAISVIRQWKYSPARMNNQPVRLWLHQIARIQYAEPIYISVGTILCSTPEEAESLYAALTNGNKGEDDTHLTPTGSNEPKTFVTEEVNVYSYPKHIQQVLLSLDRNIFSKPVKYGDHYAIFKRL
jgi:TonB family protein